MILGALTPMLLPELEISLIDRLEELREVGRLFDSPNAIEGGSEQVQIPLSEQPDCDILSSVTRDSRNLNGR
jgi:hypothetical protein